MELTPMPGKLWFSKSIAIERLIIADSLLPSFGSGVDMGVYARTDLTAVGNETRGVNINANEIMKY
jgi:hypothetical protein